MLSLRDMKTRALERRCLTENISRIFSMSVFGGRGEENPKRLPSSCGSSRQVYALNNASDVGNRN